jgi:hypothetical protein
MDKSTSRRRRPTRGHSEPRMAISARHELLARLEKAWMKRRKFSNVLSKVVNTLIAIADFREFYLENFPNMFEYCFYTLIPMR